MVRYDSRGHKSHQLSIHKTRDELVMITDAMSYVRPIYNLRYEVSDWLKANCSDTYRVLEGRVVVDIHFQSERDATLFWTFHA